MHNLFLDFISVFQGRGRWIDQKPLSTFGGLIKAIVIFLDFLKSLCRGENHLF